MIFYVYDNEGFFIGTTNGQINPKKRDEFLKPSNSTNKAPPVEYSINETPKFNEVADAWELVKSQYKINLENAQLEEVNEYGVYLYELKDGEVVLRSEDIVNLENNEEINRRALLDYENAIDNLRANMNIAILEKAKEVTKGTTTESVQAFTQAFQLRANKASQYVNAGLKVYYPIDGYNLLDALDTEVKIADYYSKILIELDLFREAKIAEYIAAKALLTPPN